jgi:hypothetical protein
MKIIQSLWSKPLKEKITEENYAGWPSKTYYLMSWALSCLQLKKYYSDVHLYTDKAGYQLLIEEIGIPYDKVFISLNEIDHYDTDLWALGKIYTYQLQKEPFLHIDGDIYLYEQLPERLSRAALAGQNIESANPHYKITLEKILYNFEYVPEFIKQLRFESLENTHAVNAGILGGQDILFFQKYTREVFEFIDKNKSEIKKANLRNFNMFFEQLFFYYLAKNGNKKISSYYENFLYGDTFPPGLYSLDRVPYEEKYIHILSNYKTLQKCCDLMANQLLINYPDFYFRIKDLTKKNPARTFSFDVFDNRHEQMLHCLNTLHHPHSLTKYNPDNHTPLDIAPFFSNTIMVLEKVINGDPVKISTSCKDLLTFTNFIEAITHSNENTTMLHKIFFAEKEIYEYSLRRTHDPKEIQSRYLMSAIMVKHLYDHPGKNLKIGLHADHTIISSFALSQKATGYEMKETTIALIPQLESVVPASFLIDEYDEILLEILKFPKTLNETMSEMMELVESYEDNKVLKEFQQLCVNKIYNLISQGICRIVDFEAEFADHYCNRTDSADTSLPTC